MMPEQRQDRSALRWIRGEFDQTLREARNALEDVVDGQHERIGVCIDKLHHAHGALEMVQMYGAAMLIDEMEQLAQAMSQGTARRGESAAEALMLGMVQLPAYLEKIENGGADIPLALLPLMNDLRAARDAPLVSETSLFAPRLDAQIAAETVRPGSGNRELPHLIHQHRSQYHRGLLQWIKGEDVAAALAHICEVFDVLNSAAGTARFRRLLDAADALATALRADEEAPALAVKPLFGKLDRVFKQIIDQGEEAAMLDFPVDLLKNILYYVARSNSTAPNVTAVKQAADLANNFPEIAETGEAAGSLGAPDRELFDAVGDALAQDLRDVKDQLDLYMRSDRSQLSRLTDLAQPIQRIGDTLGMVGRGELRTRLKQRGDTLRKAEASAETLPDDELMALAGDLLYVESALADLASGIEQSAKPDQSTEAAPISQSVSEGEMQQHVRSAIEEAQAELVKTKDAILAYLEKPAYTELLNDVPAHLHRVSGVLRMLKLPEAARMLGELTPYVAGLASGEEEVPSQEQRDALADVVISAECYMQTAVEPGADRPKLLAYAEDALERLGVRAPAGDVVRPEPSIDGEVSPPPEIDDLVSEPAAEAQPLDMTQAPAPQTEGGQEGEDDAEILEIFGEEAREELRNIQRVYPNWREDRGDLASLQAVRRAFHTLKGSGRIVGAGNIGEFSWAIENLLNRVIDGAVTDLPGVIGLMDDAVAVLPRLVEECQDLTKPGTDVSWLAERAFALASGEPPAEASRQETSEESILSDSEAADSEFSTIEPSTLGIVDSSLNSVFLSEALGHIAGLGDFVQRGREQIDGIEFDEDLRRAMHTLRGSARVARIPSIAELAGALEDFSNAMYEHHRLTDDAVLDLFERSHRMLHGLAETVGQPHASLPAWEGLGDEISRLAAELAHEPMAAASGAVDTQAVEDVLDPELLEIFLEESRELLDSLEGEQVAWESALDDASLVARLQRTLHTIKGGARLTGVSSLGDLSHALESVFESVSERRVQASDELARLVRHATDVLAQDVEQLHHAAVPAPHPDMIARLEAAARGREWEDVAPLETAISQITEPRIHAPPVPTPEAESKLVEESQQLIEPESLLTERPPSDSELLTDSQLLTDSELLSDSGLLTEMGTAPAGLVEGLIENDQNVVQFPGHDQSLDDEGFVPRRPPPEKEAAPAAASERVRVSSEVLDYMVNNAGEVSIYRARLEQQNTTVAFNLAELQQTTDRLRSQLRDLELETEAQILSRHERETETRADFDPLEMDRYSTMQQLSRALSETVEDLSNLGQALSELNRDTDTLLSQQARVTTDLQDSLLRTRMVKFSSRVPRLERVVRQTSHSLGKQASLEVVGGDEDMDRAILERMMGPLEHLLRNAVSHGIEDSETRRAEGKSQTGVISLHIQREGADVLLTLADDGAGLDRKRIRAKALERGLLDADASINDDDLYQLILQPGFSTAEELSQVSGRGVGMDVVLTEVKQLGGALEIGSRPGKGASFTIRLPFTLAITDSLLVTLGDEIYAVPHSSMDGVVRISLDELRAIYAGEQETFHYEDRDYQLRYLGSMLGTQRPHLSDGQRWLPLLLVRSGEHRVAIQVDSLLGNRQIVVKSIGAQLSTVRWFTGGTILADGQIALILDVNSLVRMDSTQPVSAESLASKELSKGVSVMVVDDSITVRKVTSRLLERHNMQVVTAKDGVDAVTLLQEHHPDVMLLDIEMPRMDGYELARHMRSTPELSDIPIIMITSRSGDKHRDRALELGVRRYLGKPYQEAELLEHIYTVLADTAL